MAENHTHPHENQERILPDSQTLDTGQKSLADALRLSFWILKLIMLAVVVLYAVSGVYRVNPGEQALVLMFGKVQGQGQDRVKGPGLGWTFPEPISEIVRIPTKEVQTLAIDSFWYFETEAQRTQRLSGRRSSAYGPLNPLQDGFTLTRNDPLYDLEGTDYNIVHCEWSVTYRIGSPVDFFENVYMRSRSPGEDFLEAAAETINPLIESFASDAIVNTLVHYSIDDAVSSKAGIANDVKNRLQRKLDVIESGIQVDAVRARSITWPRQVDDAFLSATQASQQAQQLRIDARTYKEKTLTDTGGPRAEELLKQLKQEGLPQDQREEYVTQMSGRVRTEIAQAEAEKTRVVQEAKAAADKMRELLPEYRKNPELVLQRLYQDAIIEILQTVDEKIMIPPTQENAGREIRLQLNRDPQAKKPAGGSTGNN